MESNILLNFVNKVDGLTKKPEKYLSIQDDEIETAKILTKDLYNYTKEKENSKMKSSEVLEKLVIKNLDEEQIWQQIELQNNLICNNLVSDVAHLLAKKESLKFPLKEKIKNEGLLKINDKAENFDKSVKNKTKSQLVQKVQKKSSVVDDKFFKLHEMENFLEKIEKGVESDESDEVEIDYFEDDNSLNSNDKDDKQLHYSDFFDQPDEEVSFESRTKGGIEGEKFMTVKFKLNENKSENEYEEDQEDLESLQSNTKNSQDDNFSNSQDSDSSSIDHDTNNTEKEDEGTYALKSEPPEQPSTFELRQKRIKTRIQNLEEEALREKPWQLKGEVSAINRPQNSLLEEYVEFDIATRPAPVLTEKSTLILEDVIIQRIKDKAWDDVVRKFKPTDIDTEYKKKLVLDQEKSKLSLAQIYEKEYLKQMYNKNDGMEDKSEVEPPEHQEIKSMMSNLFSKLDALSNFHFTPKQVAPEVKIVSNIPAISMEEVAPVATSFATLLAPEEVKAKPKGDLIGKSERTSSDKKRERKQKKLKQKLKYKKLEAKTNLKKSESDSKNLQNKKMSLNLLKKITQNSSITQLEESKDGSYVKSSNTFFSKLQNETSGIINKKGVDLKKVKVGKKAISKASSKKSIVR